MNTFLVFVTLLGVLFLLSRATSAHLGLLIYSLTKSKKLTVGVISFIFLPGTIIHEFSHAAIAQLLRVHTGEIKLMPEMDGKSIKLGSVQVAQSDPFRQFLIGVAPLIVGITLIFLLVEIASLLSLGALWQSIISFYVLFQVGNTMYSSKQDMKGSLELFAAIAAVVALLYLFGQKEFIENLLAQTQRFRNVPQTAIESLLGIIVIDLVVIVLSKLVTARA